MLPGRYDADTGIVTYFPAHEAGARRQAWIDAEVVPRFTARLAADDRVRSAVLTADESDRWAKPHLRDEVHLVLLFSVLDEADVEGALRARADWARSTPDPNQPAEARSWRRGHTFRSDDLVPLFGALCPPGPGPGAPFTARSPLTLPTVVGRLHRDRATSFTWEASPERPWLEGIRAVGYEADRVFPAAEGDLRRRRYVHDVVLPQVEEHFAARPVLRSAALTVAQYWDDNAHDEVHLDIIVSARETPDLAHDDFWYESDGSIPEDTPGRGGIGLDLRQTRDWVPLFAACCPGAATQDDDSVLSHRVLAIFRRRADGRGVDVEIVGEVLRPWLDGLQLSPGAWT